MGIPGIMGPIPGSAIPMLDGIPAVSVEYPVPASHTPAASDRKSFNPDVSCVPLRSDSVPSLVALPHRCISIPLWHLGQWP